MAETLCGDSDVEPGQIATQLDLKAIRMALNEASTRIGIADQPLKVFENSQQRLASKDESL